MSLALGAAASSYADYFETCRHTGNEVDYTRSHVSTDGEADEIREATEFYELVETWIESTFPTLKK